MTAAKISDLSLKDWMSAAGVTKWLSQLNAADAAVPRKNVRTALKFFHARMSTLPPAMALNFLRAMDLSRRVAAVMLNKGERIIAFRTPTESEFKLFYTRSGASRHASGINPHGRVAVHYRVHIATPALESYTTGAIDVWSVAATHQRTTVVPHANSTGVMAYGGGIQLIIPNAARSLIIDTAGQK